MTIRNINLGAITLGNAVQVTDPCYNPRLIHSRRVNIHPGNYVCSAQTANIANWGTRVMRLRIIHENHPDAVFNRELAPIGVDSGQAGFFDAAYYGESQPDENGGLLDRNESWYKRICDITLNGQNCGTIDEKGTVSESGFGDGVYRCVGASVEANGIQNIVGLEIIFITKAEAFEYNRMKKGSY